MTLRSLVPAIGLASALATPGVAVGQDQFIIDGTSCILGMEEIITVVGEDGDPASIVDLPRERACAAAETEDYVAKVRGQKVLITTEQGKMSVDYGNTENPIFAMYNASNNTHAVWTAEEFEALLTQMMGGEAERDAMADAMQQARGAMGEQNQQPVEGLYPLNSMTDCDDQAFGAHQGEVSLDADNMQENWLLRACVTNRYPDALKTFRVIQQATDQFESIGEAKAPIDQKEDELADRGLPVDVRKLTQGGGFTPGLEYEVSFFSLEEAAVSESDVSAEDGTKVPLQEFMTSLMGGPGMN